jgi:hypothetical protein
MPVILALRRLRQEDREFKAGMSTQQDPISNKTKQNNSTEKVGRNKE